MTLKEAQKKYTRIARLGDYEHSTMLSIGGGGFLQEFVVVDRATPKRARWYAKMLGVAIARLVNEECRQCPPTPTRTRQTKCRKKKRRSGSSTTPTTDTA